MSKIKLLVEIDEEDYGDFCDWFESVPSSVDGLPCVKGKFNTVLYDAKPYDDSGDLISREALKKELNSRPFPQDYSTTLLLGVFNELIDNAPTVEERPQAEWIDYDNTFYKCPDCGYLLEKCCPQCQNKVILPKGGAE